MNLDRYMRPIAMSDPGRHAALFDGLPRDTGVLAKTVQGLVLIHQHIACSRPAREPKRGWQRGKGEIGRLCGLQSLSGGLPSTL